MMGLWWAVIQNLVIEGLASVFPVVQMGHN